MTRTTASEARRNLFALLDAAERGEEVFLERRGVRFRLQVVRSDEARRPPAPPPFDVSDDVLAGEWTWVSDEDGQLHFKGSTG